MAKKPVTTEDLDAVRVEADGLNYELSSALSRMDGAAQSSEEVAGIQETISTLLQTIRLCAELAARLRMQDQMQETAKKLKSLGQ